MLEPRLPIELWELVIDNLNDDEKLAFQNSALLACSLTCKAFLPVTRRVLFYHVHLTCREVAESFLDIICSLPSSTSPCRYVRKLFMSDLEDGPGWISKASTVLVERLPYVTTLGFDTLIWDLLDDVCRRAILSGFLKVRNLDMVYSIFGTSEQMNQFISSFPSLINLYCSSTRWRRDDDGPLHDALPQGLQMIALDSHHSLFFHRLLSRESHASHSVRALKFHYIDPADTENVGRLLETLGSRLEELDLGDIYDALGDKQCNAEGQRRSAPPLSIIFN